VTLTANNLNETDTAVLNLLSEGRVTPQYVADQLDISRPYASEKLKRFVEHGHVIKLAPGLYELQEDPRNVE
jgi:predicted transcriptional regulator